jgi:HicA toxin of bacterial toxin-antitoxin,
MRFSGTLDRDEDGVWVVECPSISGKECIKVLEKAGFYQKRQESSHIIMRRDEPFE